MNTDNRRKIDLTSLGYKLNAVKAVQNPIDAIIELITNSDDAYDHVKHNRKRAKSIIIELPKRAQGSSEWKLIVADKAIGMSAEELDKKIGSMGQNTSGYQDGAEARGIFSMGAKDIAIMGDVKFESIKNGKYAWAEVTENFEFVPPPEEEVANDTIRKRMGLEGNQTGTKVTITVKNRQFRRPIIDSLVKKLSSHCQLRDIVSSKDRKVSIRNTKGKLEPVKWIDGDQDEVLNTDISIPGYPEATAKLQIWRYLEEPDDENKLYRTHGVLVQSGKGIHENSTFGLDRVPLIGWFGGRLSCSYIDTLQRDFIDKMDSDTDEGDSNVKQRQNNPTLIIRRDRKGLESNHPFRKALYEEAAKQLKEVIREWQELQPKKETELSNKDKKTLNKVAKWLADSQKKFDEDLEGLDPTDGEVPPIRIVPGKVKLYMRDKNPTTTLTVQVNADNANVGDVVEVSLDHEKYIWLESKEVKLEESPHRPDVLTGKIRVGSIAIGSVVISAKLLEEGAEALVDVLKERTVKEKILDPPETINFESKSYGVGYRRNKELRIFASSEYVHKHGAEVHITSSKPGVVSKRDFVTLVFNDLQEFYIGKAQVKAMQLNCTSIVEALQKGIGVVAETKVKVTRAEVDGAEMNIEFSKTNRGQTRAEYIYGDKDPDYDVDTIIINGFHPAISKVLSKEPRDPISESDACKMVLSEILCDTIVHDRIQKEISIYGSANEIDVDYIKSEQLRHTKDILPGIQQSFGVG